MVNLGGDLLRLPNEELGDGGRFIGRGVALVFGSLDEREDDRVFLPDQGFPYGVQGDQGFAGAAAIKGGGGENNRPEVEAHGGGGEPDLDFDGGESIKRGGFWVVVAGEPSCCGNLVVTGE